MGGVLSCMTLRERCVEALIGTAWPDGSMDYEAVADFVRAEQRQLLERIRKNIDRAWYDNGYDTAPDDIEAAIRAAERETTC